MIIGTNFKLSSKKYLDNRQQCASLNDLIINKDSILYPQGFEVYCIKEKAWYQNVSEGDTPEWKIRQNGTSEGGASIDDTKISATTTWSSEYIYDMKLELQDLITQTEDYVAEIDDRLLYVEGRLTSIGSFDGSYDSLTNKPEFPSLQGYATHEYVDEVIANIGKIEGTKDYNELINQPINNAAIEYMIDERLIVNVDYFEVGKWYIVNTDLNEEYNSATSFSLVYYLSSDSYSIINTFENEDMHSFIYVSSINEKEIKIKYTTVDGKTYELIYNKETNKKTLNLLSSSGGNGNGGFSGDYNDLENRPCYEDEGDIPEYLNIEIYSDTDFSDKESVEVRNGTSDNGNCITYRKYVKLFSDITIDMINTMKEYGVFISEYEGQLTEDPLIDFLDESQADRGMYFIGLEFEFILQAPEGYYLPENGLWYMESYVDRDLNGNLITEYKTVDDFDGILLIKDNGELNAGTIKQLDEKFIPDTIARKDYVDNAIINTISIIRPYEVFRVEETIFGKTGYIDVETMEASVKYGLTEEYLDCNSFAFVIPTAITPYAIVCIASSFQVSDLIVTEKWEGNPSKGEEGLYIIIKGLNVDYKINIRHKESKSGITIETIRNTRYLDINNTKEFIPTGDYNPATKKYVDEAVENSGGGVSDYNDLENKPVYDDRKKVVITSFDAKEMSDRLKDEESFFVLRDGALEIDVNKDYSITLDGKDLPVSDYIKASISEVTWLDFNWDTYPEGFLDNSYCLYYWTLNDIEIIVIPHTTINDYILSYSENQYTFEFYRFGDNYQIGEGLVEISTMDGEFKQLDEKFIPDTLKDYNNLENKPCYELNLENVINYDGDYENKNIVYDNLVHVSDKTISVEEFIEGEISVTAEDSGVITYSVKDFLSTEIQLEPTIEALMENYFFTNETGSMLNVNYNIIIVYDDNFIDDFGVPIEKGIWFVDYHIDDPYNTYISSLKYFTYDFKQLDEKFIPDTIARVKDLEDIPNYNVSFSNKLSFSSSALSTVLNNKIDNTKTVDTTKLPNINIDNIYKFRFTTTTGEFIDVPLKKTVDNSTQIKYAGYLYAGENNTLPVVVGMSKKAGYVTTTMSFSRPTETVNTSYLTHIIDTSVEIVVLEGVLENEISSYALSNDVEIKNSLSMNRSGNSIIGLNSTALGGYNVAQGNYSFAEGLYTIAKGIGSHAEGNSTIASNSYQHVQGKYNIEDTENKYAHIVGNGGGSIRSNAHTLDWNGNAWYQGNVTINGTPTENNHLVTKKYVDDITESLSNIDEYITETELEEKGYLTEIPTEYITDTELTNKGYITNTELEGKGYITDTELEEEMVFETDILTVNALGGISADTDLNGLTVKEILNKLLFPYIAPVITVTATPNGGTYEKGDTQTITNVKVVVTKKSEKITKIEVLNGTQVIARQNDEAIVDGGTFNYAVNVSVPSTNKQLTVKITDNSGAVTTETTNSFTFVYPYYWGVCEETDVINADLIKGLTKSVTSKGTKTVTYTTNNQKMIFAYPKSYGTIKKILDPNSFDVTSTFTMSQMTIIGLDGTGQSYYVYVNSPSTVSDFNMKFSY